MTYKRERCICSLVSVFHCEKFYLEFVVMPKWHQDQPSIFFSSYLNFFYYFKMSPDELCLLTFISLYGKPSLMLKSNSKKIYK